MQAAHASRRLNVIVTSTMLLAGATAHAQTARPAPRGSAAQIQQLQRQVAEQNQLLDSLKRAVAEQEAKVQELQRSFGDVQQQQQAAQRAAEAQAQAQAAAAAPTARPSTEENAQRTVRVGAAPEPAVEAARSVAQLFDQPGVLTPKGQVIVEPSLQYGYSSTNRAALVGFTVIPAVLIGLVDVREVKRNTVTGAIGVRYGLTNRFEVEGKLPYVYRSDSAISREIFTGTASESVFNASGKGIGDFEMTGRYQLTDGSATRPYLIGSLRFKSRTGRDPFDVVTDCVTRCVGNTTGTGQPLDLATGSGFYTLQPGLTWLFPSDPAVFFGSFTYGYNFKRNGLSRQVLGGVREPLGTVSPGDVLGMNFGMGLALNDRSSFSIGMDLNSIGRTRQNGQVVAGSVRTQLATLLLGYSYRYSDKTTVNVAVGAGLTRDTPDLTLTLRVPFSF
jgi:hypothetical protein